ncbi:hypothetical protein [Dietzia sp. ANT_WB102]|uniref:hypothetical protein n=1 Tax=Dietzia sp. ANT_WB102 TaxID=2597345 RepID=UPI00165DD3C0|nr:hypothetical protein [Dietzia sp. ANT_WB102]
MCDAGHCTGSTEVQWIGNAYLLPLGAVERIGGALGDHQGRKRIFRADSDG